MTSGTDTLAIVLIFGVVQLVALTIAIYRLAREVRALQNVQRQHPDSECWRCFSARE